MKLTIPRVTALFIVVYLIGLIALFPASLAARWFVPEVPGLVLGPADGTVWNGRVSPVEYRGLNAGTLDWSVRPLSLLALRVTADLEVSRGGGEDIVTTATVHPDGTVRLAGLRGGLAIAELEQAGLVPRNIASGALLVNLETLELEDGRLVAADGRLGLTGLRSNFLPGIPLGDYTAELQTGVDGIEGEFSDLDAPITIRGNARLQPNGQYTVSGNITPQNETPEMVRRGLNFLGSPDSSGRYAFSFEGSL